ncbi:oligosaccharide flippase family protein [Kordiimonas pumila]|uniref:Oligosaccharide flippase family protein n=1 Tax=Kordiimonas pumila TaxID=2161677 RepID=A0ABV7D254_9PROT|nr:oligosaccharide flippase family protein [Kordiimonas pumila]
MTDVQAEQEDIGRQVAHGALWTLSMRLIVRLFGLVNIAILARLITKEDFGLVALLMSTSAVLLLLLEIIVRVALVRLPAIQPKHYGAAFIMRLLAGAIAGLVLVISARYLAAYFGEPRLEGALYVFAAITFVEGLTSSWVVAFQRNLEFSKDFAFEVSVGVARAIACIAFAFWFRDFWALIAGMAVAACLRVIISHIMCYGQSLKTDMQAMRDIWLACKWLSIEAIAAFVEERTDRLILGKVGTTAQLGVFSMVIDLVMLPIGNLILPLGRAVLPGLHKLRSQSPDKIAAAYGAAVSSMIAISLPVGAGLVMAADPLIRTLLGDKWEEAIILLQYLAPFMIAESVMASFNQVLIADGKLRIITVLRWARTLIYLPAMYAGFVWDGLEGAVFAKSVIAVIMVLPCYFALVRGGRVRWGQEAWQMLRSVFACAVMLLFWHETLPLLQAISPISWVQLVCVAIEGAAIYGTALYTVWWLTGSGDGIERRMVTLAAQKLARS